MGKQSYVHLDFFFEIETRYLETWNDGNCLLDPDSTRTIQCLFADFLDGQIDRKL